MNTEVNKNKELSLKLEEIDTKIRHKDPINRTKPDSPELKVAADTPVKRLMITIIGCLKDWGYCNISSVGDRASWQAMKAIILAKEELKKLEIQLYVDPSFMEPRPIIDGIEHTGANIKIIMNEK